VISKGGCTVYPIIVPTKSNLKSFNSYLVEEAGSLSLIDTGPDSENCWDIFNKALAENGFALKDLTRIIITHNHHDHVGLVNRITAIKEVPVYAHVESIHRLKRDKAFFTLRINFFKRLYQEMGCGSSGDQQVQKLEEALQQNESNKIEAEILPLTGAEDIAGLQVIETPGHSPDHLVFLDAQRKWLFAGDHLLRHISSNALVEPDRQGNRIHTIVNYMHSLKKCLELDVETVFPGHGELIRNPNELITTRLHRINDKAERILKLIRNGNTTADQLARAYYKHKYESEFSLVMSEIIGHLDYLESQNKVTKQRSQLSAVWHYSAQDATAAL
jgi:glyoxylase-like metal-dependent hydrolase (beta-lactamase superfamily II)